MWISKIIQVWYGRQKMAVWIQKTLCGGRNTENLIDSTCFYLNISQIHVFCSDISQVHMFCDDDRSKLVPGYEQSTGFPSWIIVDNLHNIYIYIFNNWMKGIHFQVWEILEYSVWFYGHWYEPNLQTIITGQKNNAKKIRA